MAVRFCRSYLKYSSSVRTIMSGSFEFNKVKDDLEGNPYYKKYANRIQELQKSNPEEFLKKLRECHEKNYPKKGVETKEVKYGNKKGPSPSFTKRIKTLDEIMKTSLLVDKSKDEIVNIWTEFHKSKDVVYSALPSDAYSVISEQSSKFPTFLLPLPRKEGYEFFVLQFDANEVHCTPLISYQTHKADAPECLTLVYYSKFADSKGVVLMKGEFDKDILSPMEAQCLVNTLHLYYGEKNEKRTSLMHTFTYEPDSFRYMDLVAELDSISLKG